MVHTSNISSSICLQFILPESKKSIQESNQEEIKKEQVTTTKSTMVVRIVKLVLLNALRVFPYSGGILLLPAIFREDNKRIDAGIPCNTIHGTRFLVVSLAFSVCHIIGKLSGYTVHKLTARRLFPSYCSPSPQQPRFYF